jgi:erythronate-4-phosphate dehydrogenase
VVDTTAVKMALSTGKIAGAVVDVWENEPAIDPALMNLVNIATPHIAGYSTDGKANGTSMVVNALAHYFNMPLTSWYPESVPAPAYPEINIECTGKTVHDIVTEAVFHTYRIEEDDKSLRMAPGDFEKLRGSYPVRREFPSFVVNLVNGSEELNEVLRNIGFKVMS